MYATLILLAGLSCALAINVTVMKPMQQGQVDVGLIIIPGNGIKAEQYRTLAEALQAETFQNMFVALTDGYTDDTVNEVEVLAAVDLGIDALVENGLDKRAPIMVAGHSNGGMVLVNLVDEELDKVEGFILIGTPLHEGDIHFYNKPVMTVVGDLDGISTVFQMAPQWGALSDDADVLDPLIFDYPVVITIGGNHAMPITGDLPADLAEQDIETEQDDEITKAVLAASIDAFITIHLDGLTTEEWAIAAAQLRMDFTTAGEMLKPILDVTRLELEDGISPWAIQAQVLLSTIIEEDLLKLKINNTNVFDELFPFNEPTVSGSDSGIALNTISAIDAFEQEPGLDTAAQVAVKLIKQEKLKEISREQNLSFTFSDPISCKEINEAAMARALELASELAKSRFESKGITVVHNEDNKIDEYTVFLSTGIVFKLEDGVLSIQSASFAEEHQECKLLSPARAMEFIAVDSLR